MTIHDRSIVHTDREIGAKQSWTPERFLLCEDVPIARTGIQEYLNEELIDDNDDDGKLKDARGKDGIIKAERREDDVFRDETLASFEGKPVVDDHPEDQVHPDNFKEHVVGVTLNPRRGEGEWSDFIIADLLIQDASAIEAVRNGKREVSCGYDAEYEALGPGRVRQYNIIGNHVALVDRGRCGHHCSIKDTGERVMAKKTSVLDRIMSAFKTKDEKALKLALDEAGIEGLEEKTDDGDEPNGAEGIHIHIHGAESGGTSAAGDPDLKTDESGSSVEGAEQPKSMEDRMAALEAGMASMADAIQKIAGSGGSTEEEQAGEENPEETAQEETEEAAEEGEEMTDGDPNEEETAEQLSQDEDFKKGEEGALTVKDKRSTKDSSVLKVAFQAAISGAEIIAPGLKMPTFDRAAATKSTHDNICLIKRRALAASARTADGAEILKLVTGESKLRAGMTCDALGVVFNAAVALTKDKNDVIVKKDTPRTLFNKDHKNDDKALFANITSPADFNAAARKRYSQTNKH